MLVNLTPDLVEMERRKQISIEHKFTFIPQSDPRLNEEVGVYQCNFDFNFSDDEFIEKFTDYNDFKLKKGETLLQRYGKGKYVPTYGVADNVEQIKEFYKKQIKNKKEKFCISMTPVYQERKNKGKYDGWRWHKWGEYIGKLNPQCEYLDDENFGDNFEYVICFNLHFINN